MRSPVCSNRRAIVDRLEKELQRSRREHTALAVGMIDIDHFKRVNDEHGHAAGDAVLCELARRMQSALRPYDHVGRFGGEEFLVVVPGVSRAEFAGLLERLREVVCGAPFTADGRDLPVTVSLGGAEHADESMDALIARADDALYVAKARGRDLVVLAER